MICLPFTLVLWLSFLFPAGIVMATCRMAGRQRVNWFKLEYAFLIVPYLTWVILVLMNDKGKSLSNAIGEPFLLGCCVAIASLIRLAVGRKCNEALLAASLFAGCCLLAIALWAFVPILSE